MSRTFGTPNKRRPIYRFWWISDDFKKRNQSAVWELSWNMPNTTPATLILNIYIYIYIHMQEIWTWILHDLNVWHFLLAWSWSCNFATSFSMLLYITFFFPLIRSQVVLNSLSHDDYIPKSLGFLKKGGRFMEIGTLVDGHPDSTWATTWQSFGFMMFCVEFLP